MLGSESHIHQSQSYRNKMKLLIVLSLCSIALAVRYEMPQQWNLWKSQHGKAYKSDKEDLERHLNWVSNKKYIDMHNANADVFGFRK